MSYFVECSCRLAIDLLKMQTEENCERNIILSPMSLELGLAVLLLGSRGTTADQLRKVLYFLHWTEPETSTDIPLLESHRDKLEGLHTQFKQLLPNINHHSKSYVLNIVNRLYVSNTYDFLENYKQSLRELYNSELENVDFMNAAESVREKLIPGLKGKPVDRSIYVEMMTREGNFNLANITNPSMTVVELPFENEQLSFFFILPGLNENIDEIIKLTYEILQEWTSSENMRNITAKLYIPKFSVEDKYSMKPILKGMGVNELFIPGKANLSGISGKPGLFVGDFMFTGSISVSEDGVHAAGASRPEIVCGTDKKITFNNPFIGILRNKHNGAILSSPRFVCQSEQVLP